MEAPRVLSCGLLADKGSSVLGFVFPNFTVAAANVAAIEAGVEELDIHGARQTMGTSPHPGDDLPLRLLARRRHCSVVDRVNQTRLCGKK